MGRVQIGVGRPAPPLGDSGQFHRAPQDRIEMQAVGGAEMQEGDIVFIYDGDGLNMGKSRTGCSCPPLQGVYEVSIWCVSVGRCPRPQTQCIFHGGPLGGRVRFPGRSPRRIANPPCVGLPIPDGVG